MTAVPLLWSPHDPLAVGLNVATAIGGSFAAGFWAHRLGLSRLGRDGPVLRIRWFEAGGRLYRRYLGVHRWKDRLPEAGAFFPGGQSKRHLPGADRDSLFRFAAETRRAERAHWVALGIVVAAPVLWNRPLGVVLMTAYGAMINGPCIVVQRYNRARLLRLLAGDRADVTHRPPATLGP